MGGVGAIGCWLPVAAGHAAAWPGEWSLCLSPPMRPCTHLPPLQVETFLAKTESLHENFRLWITAEVRLHAQSAAMRGLCSGVLSAPHLPPWGGCSPVD